MTSRPGLQLCKAALTGSIRFARPGLRNSPEPTRWRKTKKPPRISPRRLLSFNDEEEIPSLAGLAATYSRAS